MSFWDGLKNMLVDSNIAPVDVRNPNQMAAGNMLMSQYGAASANPNYGLPTPELQRLQEDELSRDILGRTGSAGAGGSGYAGEQVRKGLTDFRISMIGQRQRALDSLRSAMIMGQGPGMAPAQRQTGLLPDIARNVGGTLGQRGGNALANDAFGEDPNARNNAAAVPGGAPGTTGYRPPGMQSRGGMGVSGT